MIYDCAEFAAAAWSKIISFKLNLKLHLLTDSKQLWSCKRLLLLVLVLI